MVIRPGNLNAVNDGTQEGITLCVLPVQGRHTSVCITAASVSKAGKVEGRIRLLGPGNLNAVNDRTQPDITLCVVPVQGRHINVCITGASVTKSKDLQSGVRLNVTACRL